MIYTAVTRAKRLLVLVGSMRALRMAVRNVRGVERQTLLRRWMTSADEKPEQAHFRGKAAAEDP